MQIVDDLERSDHYFRRSRARFKAVLVLAVIVMILILVRGAGLFPPDESRLQPAQSAGISG